MSYHNFSNTYCVIWATSTFFGVILYSNFPFSVQVLSDSHQYDLIFSCQPEAPAQDWLGMQPVYSISASNPNEKRRRYLFRTPDWDVLHTPEIADFYISEKQILCCPSKDVDKSTIELHLLSYVISYWLEKQSVIALHASAVKIGDFAVGFFAHSGSGKSTLAASFLQAGFLLLTDDIFPIEEKDSGFFGRPGYPSIRLTPTTAKLVPQELIKSYKTNGETDKTRLLISPYGFSGQPAPLACLYLPQRRSTDERDTVIQIAPLTPRDAVIELLRHSFTRRLVQAAGLAVQRLEVLTRLVQQVPLRKLVYPSSLEKINLVRQAIYDNLADVEMKKNPF